MNVMTPNIVNGLDLDGVAETVAAILTDPTRAQARFAVTTRWDGGTRSTSSVAGPTVGGETLDRQFEIVSDEPIEMLGTNTGPNPQELLMAAVNACMTVGYVAGAAQRGITLDRLEIETVGELDLRGFFGLDDSIPPGYPQLDYAVRIAGNGTPEQFEEIHRAVMSLSPNYYNLAHPVRMNGTLALI